MATELPPQPAATKRYMRHGYSPAVDRHPLYLIWNAIKRRCLNKRSKAYFCYGGRGITICEEWTHNAAAFIQYVETVLGPKPTPSHSIDRKDNDGNYEPGNIRWASKEEQMFNRRPFSEWEKNVSAEYRSGLARERGKKNRGTPKTGRRSSVPELWGGPVPGCPITEPHKSNLCKSCHAAKQRQFTQNKRLREAAQ